MAEQLRGDQITRDSSAVHVNECARAAIGSSVDGPRNKLFTRSRLASYEDRRIAWRNFRDTREFSLQSWRGPNNLFKHRCLIDFFAQRNVLVLEPLLRLLALLDISRSGIPTCDASLFIS